MRAPAPSVAGAEAQPDDLGRSATDIEDNGVGHPRIEQRGAAADDETCLLDGRDDLDLEADLVAHAAEELVAIRRAAACLGRDIAPGGDRREAILSAQTLRALDGAHHRPSDKRAGRGQPFTEPNDARERIDDAKPRPAGRATSRRQLLVPRSSAAK